MVEPGSSPEEGRELADEALPVDPMNRIPAGEVAEPIDSIPSVPALPPADSGEEILEALPAPPLGDVEELADLPTVLRITRPPHPPFWWAVLWCGFFLLVTQIIPSIPITLILLAAEVLQAPNMRAGLDRLGTKEAQEELQHRAIAPLLLASQVMGIAFSCVALRLVAGRQWKRQVGLRLPGVTHLILALVGFPALPILASGAYALAKRLLPGLPQVLPLLSTEVFVLGAFWLLLRVVGGAHWNRALARKPLAVQLGFVFGGVIAIVLSSVGVYHTYELATQVWPIDLTLPPGGEVMEKMVKEFRDWPWFAGVLIIGLGPGISEELWCRGFLGRGLVGHYGVILGVLLTSFLFGLIHGDPHQGTMAMLMGIALHFTYLATRSLLIPMLLHFLNNSLSVLASKFGEELEKIDTSPDEISLWMYLASWALFVVVGWALYRSRTRLVAIDGAGPPTWQPAFPSVALPPPGTNTVVVQPRLGWVEWLLVIAAAAGFGCVFVFI